MIPFNPQAEIGIGADFGFRSDSSAIVVVQKVAGVYHIADLLEVLPSKGAPLQPSVICRRFAEIVKRYGGRSLTADAHYAESIREHLQQHELQLERAPEGQDGKAETYVRARALFNEGRVRIPRHARLIGQLKAIVSKPTPGGGISISSPRRGSGGHGDLVSALVLALWSAQRRGETRYVPPRAEDVAYSSARAAMGERVAPVVYDEASPTWEHDPARGSYNYGGF